MSTPQSEYVAELTPAQVRALQALANHARREDAAHSLGWRLETLKSQTKEARGKLGAPNNLAAVVVAMRAGVIE